MERKPPASPAVDVAMILAAGLGTRLRPLTHERPKPLVEVLGTPLLHFALRHALAAGARRVAINTHHLPAAIEEALGPSFEGVPLTYSHEPVILGTGGGVRQMAERLGGVSSRFLLLNADALVDVDTRAMVARHEERRPTATLALKDVPGKERFGLLGTDDDDRVRTFAGRTRYAGPVAKERMFCGVHVIEPALLERLPLGEESCINRVGYPPLLDEGGLVIGFDVPGYFCDVGTPERLLEANLLLLSGRVRLSHLDPFARFVTEGDRHLAKGARVEPGATLEGPVVVDEGAVIEAGARVAPLAVIGKGCRVGAGAVVERAVLQSGAEVGATEGVRDSVLGPTCRMDVAPAVVDELLATRAGAAP